MADNKIQGWELVQRQSLPLDSKIEFSKRRIRDFYEAMDGNVFVTFSGGKDSTVLLHLVRSIYPNVEAIFVDTGLEFPEVRKFVKTFKNVKVLKPSMYFKEIIDYHGYPVISKSISTAINRYRVTKKPEVKQWRKWGKTDPITGKKLTIGVISKKWHFMIDAPFKISEKCCRVMKKVPSHNYMKETGKAPYIGTMASEGHSRKMDYLKRGCNLIDSKWPQSRPLMIWNDDDIWGYIKKFKLDYCEVYDKGYERTGCIFCMFGVHNEKEPNRFQLLKKTHPKLYKYGMEKLKIKEVLEYMGVPYE